jgi:hypothetical protein
VDDIVKKVRIKPEKAYTVEEKRIKHPNAYKKWTSEEDAVLKEKYKQVRSIQKLSALFQRNPGAIRSRLKKLGLMEDQSIND